MNRLDCISALMTQKDLKNYLEIGVFNGGVFFRVKSTFKIAVDPEFAFDTPRKFGKMVVNPHNIFNQYFEKTSDAFFAEDAPGLFAETKVQLSLVDGMHEYGFALRDVENTLRFLSDDGVIIMHDCNPATEIVSGTYEQWRERGADAGDWNGDVWKSIVHLRSTRNDINVFVLDCDYGLGIVTKAKPETKLTFAQKDIESMSYKDLEAHRAEWLNLKPVAYFKEYFKLK